MTGGSVAIPFSAEVSVTPRVDHVNVDLTLLASDRTSRLEDARDLLDVFCRSVNAGTFTSQASPSPEPCQLHELPRADRAGAHIRLGPMTTDSGAYRVLVQTLVQSHFVHESLARLEIRAGAPGTAALGLPEVLSLTFPARARTPFPVLTAADLPENREPVLRLRFGLDLDPTAVERVVESLLLWESLVIQGGYLEPFDPADLPSMRPGEIYTTLPNEIEQRLTGFVAHKAAFNGMINACRAIHAHVAPLALVEIGDVSPGES